jgi:hypothetical protein
LYYPSSGALRTLAERWNGTKWTVKSTPNPTGSMYNELVAVDCSSATACSAVGNYNPTTATSRTLAERWNGTKWTLKSTPNTGSAISYLEGVACTSSTTCTAVGYDRPTSATIRTLAERWNGTKWAVQNTPNPSGSSGINELYAVACPRATICTAVGAQQKNPTSPTSPTLTLAERYS